MFKNVQEASQRWITEGKAHYDLVINYLDINNFDDELPPYDYPEEPRSDMGGYVMEQIIAYNQTGKQAELRQLFPPDNIPLFDNFKGVTECVWQAVMLPDNRLVVTVGYWEERRVYLIKDNDFFLQQGLFMFGKSADKKYFAKVYADKITITEGWDGTIVKTLYAPEDYGAAFKEKHPHIKDGLGKLSLLDFGIHQVVVFPSGERIALASTKGIFIIDEKGARFIQTENDDNIVPDDNFTFIYDYPHIDVSPDEKYIVAGTRSSNHLLLEEVNGVWTTVATVKPRSTHPSLAKFNYKVKDNGVKNDGPEVLLFSIEFAVFGGGGVSLPIKNVTPGYFASGCDVRGEVDSTLNDLNMRRGVDSVAINSWGYAFGGRGYQVTFHTYNGLGSGYLEVGGMVMDLDYSEDENKLIVANFSGQVMIYDSSITRFAGNKMFRKKENRHEKRPDEMANTSTCYIDVKRYLFWKGYEPMIW